DAKQQKLLLERYHWRGLADTGVERPTLSNWYYVAAEPYYFAILLSPLLSFGLLFVAREKTYAILLFLHTWLVFVITFLLSLLPITRYLQPLSLLMLLSVALAVKCLCPATATAMDTNVKEASPSRWLDINGRQRVCVV